MNITSSICCESVEDCCQSSTVSYTVTKDGIIYYTVSLPYGITPTIPEFSECGTYKVESTATNCCGTANDIDYIQVVDYPVTLGITTESCCSCISVNQAITFIPHVTYPSTPTYVNNSLAPGRCINWKVYYETKDNLIYDYGQEVLNFNNGIANTKNLIYSFYNNGKYLVELIYVDYCGCTTSEVIEVLVESPLSLKEDTCGKYKLITCPNTVKSTSIPITIVDELTEVITTYNEYLLNSYLPIPKDGIYTVTTLYNGKPYTFSIVNLCSILECYRKLIEYTLCGDCEVPCKDVNWYYTQFTVLYALLNELINEFMKSEVGSERRIYLIDKLKQTIGRLNSICTGCLSL